VGFCVDKSEEAEDVMRKPADAGTGAFYLLMMPS
jgi:hypothetical protein